MGPCSKVDFHVLKNGFSWIFEKIPEDFLGFGVHRGGVFG